MTNSVKNYEFQIGDEVEFGGQIGRVELLFPDSEFSVIIVHQNGRDSFTRDGRFRLHHTKPLLNLVKKAPVKKEFSGWVNLYLNRSWINVYDSKEMADDRAHGSRIACFEVKGEYYE